MNSHDELIAAYALGVLEGEDLTEFERRLEDDAGLRDEVEATRGTMAQLSELPGEAWPRAQTAGDAADLSLPAVEAAPAEPAPAPEPATAPTPQPRRAPSRRWTLRPAFALGALLVAAVIGGGLGALLAGGDAGSSSTPTPPVAFTLQPLAAPADSAGAISMPGPETMLLHVKGLPASGDGQYYEVWLMSDATSTVPVASFRVGTDGAATVEVPLPADPADFRYFDVSRQTVAGGTGHSDESVLRGSTGAA
jgi:anti-sigma-K factor RskA